MLNVHQILVSARRRTVLMVCVAASAAALAGCGQRGPLYLPKDPAAANRATLPDLMTPRLPGSSSDAAAPAPAGASSAPAASGSGVAQ
ncbi:MAG: hypothetical protein EOO22_20595 [Comamonadaceae bacterium]|nr:MAG: hypothetical protein EOO22_20595 [Comamonadaceae bacterium]